MSEPSHSPAPFRVRDLPPSAANNHLGGYLIIDALGDSIGALAFRTGDHPPAEQLANAHLFAGSAGLLAVAKIGRAAILQDLQLTLEAHTVPTPGTLEPDLATLDEMAVPVIEELTQQVALFDAAIAAAEGRQ